MIKYEFNHILIDCVEQYKEYCQNITEEKAISFEKYCELYITYKNAETIDSKLDKIKEIVEVLDSIHTEIYNRD